MMVSICSRSLSIIDAGHDKVVHGILSLSKGTKVVRNASELRAGTLHNEIQNSFTRADSVSIYISLSTIISKICCLLVSKL